MLRFFVHVSFLFFSLVAITGAWMRFYPFAPGTPPSLIPTCSTPIPTSPFWAGPLWAASCFFCTSSGSAFAKKSRPSWRLRRWPGFPWRCCSPFCIRVTGRCPSPHRLCIFLRSIGLHSSFAGPSEQNPAFSEIGGMFIKGSLAFLLLSSAGPFSLAFIAARGMKETPWYDMAIYFYLHFQYNGWLLLFLIGMLVLWLRRKAVPFDAGGTKAAFWMYVIALFPGYFHSILWMEPGKFVKGLAVAAGVVQFVAVLLLFRSLRGSCAISEGSVPVRSTPVSF